jgi:hypothetical protein
MKLALTETYTCELMLARLLAESARHTHWQGDG